MRFAAFCLALVMILPVCGQGLHAGQGRAVGGLICSLSAAEAVVAMGARMQFTLDIRFVPTPDDDAARFLDRYNRVWDCRFHFVDAGTGREFIRHPFDVGMLIPRREGDIIPLENGATVSERFTVCLLSDEGVQIPPGDYRVTAVYENKGWQSQKRPDKKQLSAAAFDAQKDEVWHGTIEAPAIEVKVQPALERKVEVKVNTGVTIDRSGDKIGWSWSQNAPETIELVQRPGYILGCRYSIWVVSGDTAVSGGGGVSASTFQRDDGRSFLIGDALGLALSADDARLKIDLKLFETSIPVRHMWMPDRGDFEVLWTGEIIADLNERDIRDR